MTRMGIPFALALLAALFGGTPAASQETAHELVLSLFDTADLVLLGERHWSQQDSDFRIELLRQPDFADRVDVIVVEFASSRYQELLDAYFLRLAPLTRYQLKKVWRETVQATGAWDSPLYEAFLLAVRKVNEGLLAGQRIRVVAGDPPIDWDSIEVWEDKLPFVNRGWSAVRVIERTVLARGYKALVIYGYGHFLRLNDEMEEDENLIRRLERLHPETRVSVVLPLAKDTEEGSFLRLEGELRPATLPAFVPGDSTPFRDWEAAELYWGAVGTVGEIADGLIYFGEEDEQVGPPEGLYDTEPDYAEELARRRALRPRRRPE